ATRAPRAHARSPGSARRAPGARRCRAPATMDGGNRAARRWRVTPHQYGRASPMARAGLIEADVAVVGAGAAGLYAALTASHAGGSATGRRITRQLSADVVADEHIVVLEGRRAAALHVHDGRCTGVCTHDGTAVSARGVILASGGAAALWSRTTNPPGAFGSG